MLKTSIGLCVFYYFETRQDQQYDSDPANPKFLALLDSFSSIHKYAIYSRYKQTALLYDDTPEKAKERLKERRTLYDNYVWNVIDPTRQYETKRAFSPQIVYSEGTELPFSYYLLACDNTYLFSGFSFLDEEIQNTRAFFKNPDSRIVKGGSWAHAPTYMICGNKVIYSGLNSSSTIGFRVVADEVR